MSHVYDNLLNCNLDFSLQPGVIASWEQPDELTYELTVGDGFVFQNGEPLEVEDVVYSLTRLENVSQAADLYAQIDSVSADGNVVRRGRRRICQRTDRHRPVRYVRVCPGREGCPDRMGGLPRPEGLYRNHHLQGDRRALRSLYRG